MLTLRGATYRYPGTAAPSIHEVDLELAEGSVTGVVGPSDAGKSTLCLVLSGLAPRVTKGTFSGALLLDGKDVAERPMHALVGDIATGFADPAGQLSMVADTVFEEVAFGPANLGLPRAELVERVEHALERSALTHLAARDPRRLSGGQQQLVAIAGLLAMRPRHLILDEPTAHLDARGTRLVLDVIVKLATDGAAVLVVEQDTEVLEAICSTIIAMDRGRIVAQGSTTGVLADTAVLALGIEEPPSRRLQRLMHASRRDTVSAASSATPARGT